KALCQDAIAARGGKLDLLIRQDTETLGPPRHQWSFVTSHDTASPTLRPRLVVSFGSPAGAPTSTTSPTTSITATTTTSPNHSPVRPGDDLLIRHLPGDRPRYPGRAGGRGGWVTRRFACHTARTGHGERPTSRAVCHGRGSQPGSGPPRPGGARPGTFRAQAE